MISCGLTATTDPNKPLQYRKMLSKALNLHGFSCAKSLHRNGRCLNPSRPGSALTRRSRPLAAAAASEKPSSLPYSTETEASLSECTFSAVEVDNKVHPEYTLIVVQGADTPGLLRVLSWVLNGMAVKVQHGLLETIPEGNIRDTLWVTDLRGHKLKDSSANSLRARLEDFLIMCDTEVAITHNEWRCGSIWVSNAVHPELTQLVVRGEPSSHKPGFLLELTTALTGVGASIVEGAIQGGPDTPLPQGVADPDYDFGSGRFFKFMLKGPAGGQMDADRVASLIFILRLLQGKGSMPTVAPNMDSLLKWRE